MLAPLCLLATQGAAVGFRAAAWVGIENPSEQGCSSQPGQTCIKLNVVMMNHAYRIKADLGCGGARSKCTAAA